MGGNKCSALTKSILLPSLLAMRLCPIDRREIANTEVG